MFVESAGRPDVIAGTDPADAAGLTQILAQTGQSLLGMHIDLARSRRLTDQIGRAGGGGRANARSGSSASAPEIDDRFDPRLALAATVRYLKLAEQHFGRADLAVVSYHMGIGNLQQVSTTTTAAIPSPTPSCTSTPRPTTTARHTSCSPGSETTRRCTTGGCWARCRSCACTAPTGAPWQGSPRSKSTPTRTRTCSTRRTDGVFADPNALYDAYHSRALVRLPSDPARLGLATAPSIGRAPARHRRAAALYHGLRPAALDMLVELAARVRRCPAARRPDRRQRGAATRSTRAGRRTRHGANRLHVHDRAPVREPRSGRRVPGDARPAPGARPDRVGATPATIDHGGRGASHVIVNGL